MMAWNLHSIDYDNIMEMYMLEKIDIDEIWDMVGDIITEDEYADITGYIYPDKE